MSKITFRADEELVERIEARDASKSEIMREALRAYLDGPERGRDAGAERAASAGGVGDHADAQDSGHGERRSADSLDAMLAERVDELVAERLAAREARERQRATERAQDVNVNVTLETDAARTDDPAVTRQTRASDVPSDDRGSGDRPDAEESGRPAETEKDCGQCGESLSDDHVYCPNCGEKAARRVFCECGDEVRSDWGFCPSCGRRTPAADVLDRS
ncbi:double zinc ribbon domain-containing protein [Halorussus salinisoli]|uniref:double zinc ribbon domain-containing protein n=1 Tax=Halorussus salinisoli TaxID=2558242 RepID=UPI0010C1C9C6|nr:zinc ribbon domain-containing protein [Halorussus salinisoli]